MNVAHFVRCPGFSFIRKGIIGSHKEEMTPELIEKFDNWTREYNLKNGTSIEP